MVPPEKTERDRPARGWVGGTTHDNDKFVRGVNNRGAGRFCDLMTALASWLARDNSDAGGGTIIFFK